MPHQKADSLQNWDVLMLKESHVDLQLKGNVDAFPIPVWAAVLISFFLVPLTGLFAGLTLGLLSLDRVGLRVGFCIPPLACLCLSSPSRLWNASSLLVLLCPLAC